MRVRSLAPFVEGRVVGVARPDVRDFAAQAGVSRSMGARRSFDHHSARSAEASDDRRRFWSAHSETVWRGGGSSESLQDYGYLGV
ncbi:MAG: hypothetical protein HY235_25220 [Acidobacteria bacterium]|nr:hypothetical protein [Acidobacteriota bacterium]